MDKFRDHVKRAAPGDTVRNNDWNGMFVWWSKGEPFLVGLDVDASDDRAPRTTKQNKNLNLSVLVQSHQQTSCTHFPRCLNFTKVTGKVSFLREPNKVAKCNSVLLEKESDQHEFLAIDCSAEI
jgi:hypothetical protein